MMIWIGLLLSRQMRLAYARDAYGTTANRAREDDEPDGLIEMKWTDADKRRDVYDADEKVAGQRSAPISQRYRQTVNLTQEWLLLQRKITTEIPLKLYRSAPPGLRSRKRKERLSKPPRVKRPNRLATIRKKNSSYSKSRAGARGGKRILTEREGVSSLLRRCQSK